MPVSPFASAVATAPETLPPPRAFGSVPADLDFDFSRSDRPFLVTELLAHCCVASVESRESLEHAAWNLPLGKRIVRLLRIIELTSEETSMAVRLECPHAQCGQGLEMVLPFLQLMTAAGGDGDLRRIIHFPRSDGSALPLRLPTGRDQAAWQTRKYSTQEEALTAIARSLIDCPSESDLKIDEIEVLASVMEEADPLIAFHVSTRCPHCGQCAELPVDLEACVLRHLAQRQRNLLRDVHELATRYGWTEAEVLAVPMRRRAFYRQWILADAPMQR